MSYDFEHEAERVCKAIGSTVGRMTVICALRKAYEAGSRGDKMIKRLETYTCYFVNENDREEHFPDAASAHARAQAVVGNRSYAKPFKTDNVFLYGPGDGSTSVMVRQDFEFVD
jgi:hypothetical protein